MAWLGRASAVLRTELHLIGAAWLSPSCLLSKLALLLGFAWLLVPFDVIPDRIPVVGYSDELFFTIAGFCAARRLLPGWLEREVAGRHQASRPRPPVDLPVFVINLERDKERRRHMLGMLTNLGLEAEFVTAVDGRRLAPSDRAGYGRARALRVYGVEMLDTEIACYLSHQRIHERMVRDGIEVALIMEDDVDLAPDFPTILRDLLASAFTDWLVIRFDCKRTVVRDPPSAWMRGRRVADLSHGHGLYRLHTHPLGLAAYLIRREGAIRMLEYGRPIFMPIGMTMDRYWENGIVPYVVRPIPARQMEEVFVASTGSRPPDRYRFQPFRVRAQRRVQRAVDGVSKRAFNLFA